MSASNVNGHRGSLPHEPLDLFVACSLLASCLVAIGIIALTMHYVPGLWKYIAAHLPI